MLFLFSEFSNSTESIASVSSNSSYDETLKGRPNVGPKGGKHGGHGGDSESSNSTESIASVSSNSSYDETLKDRPNVGPKGGKHGGHGGNSDSSNSTASEESIASISSNSSANMLAHASAGLTNSSVSEGIVASESVSSNSSDSSSKSGPKGKGSPKARPAEEAWVFCHATGSFGDQLTFHVKNGKCYPDYLTWAGENCGDVTMKVSEVTLAGVVSLDGMNSEIFNSADFGIVLGALSTTVAGWDMGAMQVTTSSLHARSLTTAYTHDIEFTVKFTAEDFGVDGSLFSATEGLVSNMAATLQASMTGGEFVQSMSSSATLAGANSVKDVNAAQLVSLDIVSISYADNRLVYVYDTEASASASVSQGPMMSASVMVLFVAVVALAGVAVVGMIAHSVGSYQKVSTVSDSEVSERVWLSGLKTKFGVSFEKLPADSEQLEDGLRI
jgi:hypothetical protein